MFQMMTSVMLILKNLDSFIMNQKEFRKRDLLKKCSSSWSLLSRLERKNESFQERFMTDIKKIKKGQKHITTKWKWVWMSIQKKEQKIESKCFNAICTGYSGYCITITKDVSIGDFITTIIIHQWSQILQIFMNWLIKKKLEISIFSNGKTSILLHFSS